jgi:class 3 adenylate cyclase
MRDLVRAFLEASLAEVHRYGGTAPQFTGDGFMALFGAPLTQEDHVRRALLAAVAIAERAIGRHGIRPALPRGETCHQRLGSGSPHSVNHLILTDPRVDKLMLVWGEV